MSAIDFTVRQAAIAPEKPPRVPVLVDAFAARKANRYAWNVPGWARRLGGPLLILLLWQLAVSIANVDPELVPSPADVADAGWTLLLNGQLVTNIQTSLQRVLAGLAIGLTTGLGVAVLASLRQGTGEVLDSAMQVVKAIPVFALLPLFIVWAGIGEAPKITLIAVSTALPIYINVYGAIRNVDGELVEAASVLGLRQFEVVRHLLLPAAVPGFLSGLRMSLTSCWLALIFAETVNATSGLGYLMFEAQMAFRMDIIVLVVAIYALLGIIGYGIVLGLEQLLLSWRRTFRGL